MKDILLITPPFTQLNTPYPATAYLKGFLNTKNISSFQVDLGIEVILKLFSKTGLEQMFSFVETIENEDFSENAKRIFALKETYIHSIDAVIVFLQGKNTALAQQICSGNLLPQAYRFEQLDDLEWAFGTMGLQDKAKHLATLYLEDLSDFIVEAIDNHFGFSRYAERLGRSANSFDELYKQLYQEHTYIDSITISILEEKLKKCKPKLVCFSVPFPGNLYSAFRCAKHIKQHYPEIKTAMGGGFPNTELRDLNDKRVFEFFDFITLDDGEFPIELLINKIQNPNSEEFKRTYLLQNEEVVYKNNASKPDYKQSETGTPDYSDLLLDKYISVIEIANPMHSLWSNGRWNKLTMAHGCYWKKCTFCDISLDYIKIYEPVHAKIIVDRMEEIIAQTGENGFHFVDEAAPPSVMKEVALEILKRNLIVTWWTNIRFEKTFTYDLCYLLAKSGCVAVSGGLEVASNRLLNLIQKGVSVEQVAQVCQNFSQTGIMVHAYLMYGFPSQTVQETVDSLEMVRQLFQAGVIQSGFWHQFALTAHSPVGVNPEKFGIIPRKNSITFANNDIAFKDKTGIDHEKFSFGLKKSIYNYMHGIGFDYELQEWFDFKIPKTTISPCYIEQCLEKNLDLKLNFNQKVIYLETLPQISFYSKTKKGMAREMAQLTFFNKTATYHIDLEKKQAIWLQSLLNKNSIQNSTITVKAIKEDFETLFSDFELFIFSKQIMKLRENGLLFL